MIVKKEQDILDNEHVNAINKVLDLINKEKEKHSFSYTFMEKALAIYIDNSQLIKQKRPIEVVKPFKKWQIVSIALNYYKSIDPELYQRIKKVVFGRNPKMRLNIYKLSEIKNLEETDFEFKSFKRYDKSPANQRWDNNNMVYLPMKCGWRYNKKLSQALEKDEGTIEDLYALVHELSHTLDMFLEYFTNEKGNILTTIVNNNKLFTESAAIGFEKALTKYLLEKGIINNQKYVENILIERGNDTIDKCVKTYARLVLARKKEEKGEITKEDIDEISDEMKLNPIEKANLINLLIINGEKTFFEEAGYAFSGLLSYTFEDLIHNGETERIKDFLHASKIGDFVKALDSLDIELSDNGLKKLKETMEKNRYRCETNPEIEEEQK